MPLPDPADARLVVRPATPDDTDAIVDLVNTVDVHDFGVADLARDDVVQEMAAMDLARDTWLVLDAGRLVGQANVSLHGGVAHDTNLCVHPEWRRRGIGSDLLQRVEGRSTGRIADAPEDAQVTIRGWTKGGWEPGLAFAARHGYTVTRRYLRMRIDMSTPPPAPEWPEGMRVATFVPGADERAVHAASQDAFADHWGFLATPFEEWRRRLDRDDFDPDLWWLARDPEDTIAGMSLSSMIPGTGWVGSLSVRRPWRRRGLARALLLHSFGRFWERGVHTVSLGVDAGSLTGATRLYESVGMSVEQAYDRVEKVIREGRDIAVRALE
jgi:mycothiol synthase